jgi:transposase
MAATQKHSTTAKTSVLYLAFELGASSWKLAMTTAFGQAPRWKTIDAGNLAKLQSEILNAKKRFGLDQAASVRTCYEAGRDGFWVHRYLTSVGIENLVVDSASIEVSRRKRRAKNDRLDGEKLLALLIRYHAGERRAWRVVRVPNVAEEDARHLHRELDQLKHERTTRINRLRGLLASQGIDIESLSRLAEAIPDLRTWNGKALPTELQRRLMREWERLRSVTREINDLSRERAQRIRRADPADTVEPVRQLLTLRGIGVNSSWLLSREVFGWREIQNRRQLGSLAGLTPTPYQSGDSNREQGISKAGNRRLRAMMMEIAWGWLRYQPDSDLSQWFQVRFARGNSRQRRIGIVALARKLLVALWRYLQAGEIPKGARTRTWQQALAAAA